MSPIGKIFLFLNMALAAAFLGWASSALATNQNYKEQAVAAQEELASKVSDWDVERGDLQQQVNEQKNGRSRSEEERADLQADKDRITADLAEEKRENSALRSRLDSIDSSLGDYNEHLSAVESAKDRAVADAREAVRERDGAFDERDAALAAQLEAEEERDNKIVSLTAALGTLASTTADLDQRTTELHVLAEMTGTSLQDITAVDKIDGIVVQVRDLSPGPGIVALNVGTSDGVKTGMRFDIWSGGDFKGSVIVETVHADLCSARIEDLRAAMVQGDSASTRL